MKAYVHQGRAYLGLKEYDKAMESCENALKCDPKKENIMKGEELKHEIIRKNSYF